ncbi:MAG: hypothetical protein ACR2QF_16445, partial [Geminicoccaceae bacterium]
MTSVMVAAAAAEDAGSGHLIPLPERPALTVKPAFAERQRVSNETALAKPEQQSNRKQRRKPTWKIQDQEPKAVVILNGTASPLDRVMVQKGDAVAPDGA